MLIGAIYILNEKVTLHDVDGSFVEISAKDALDLADWLNIHRKQLEQMAHETEGSNDESDQ
jgi:hypothetical protein